MLLALSQLPLGQGEFARGQDVNTAHANAGGQALADDDCDDLVSEDLVICGTDSSALAMAGDLDYLQMPRQQCEELLSFAEQNLVCNYGDLACELARARRGDIAPRTSTTRALSGAVNLATPIDFELLPGKGQRLHSEEAAMPASLLVAPPHGPPRLA